jgi:RNase P/RNase MRP subunit p29
MGFDSRPGRNVVAFDGGVTGKVVSATRRELVVQFTQKPSAAGTLSATVTTNGRSSGTAVGVATVVDAPAVTVDSTSLARGAKTLTIRGTGFDPTNLTNKVRLSGGATGVLTSATATTLTVAVRNLPAAGTQVAATVTSFGGTSGAAVTVARIVRNPIVQPSTDQMAVSSKTITIRGSGFDPSYKNNVVTFNLGAVGYVTSATKNTLVVKFTTPPSVGRLKAVVTSFGGSSNAVQVATVKPATTYGTYTLYGETDGGVYAQSFSYTGINNGYTVELISDYADVDLYNFKTSSTDISWTGTTTTSTYTVTMMATTSETNVSGDFTFDATLPGIISSYNVYDGTTLLGSGQKSD